jgi:hypothetical protein
MARLTRYTQKLFGSSAGSNEMAEFGSLAAGTPARYTGATITPDIIQTLSNYLVGWLGAVIGENSPAIEDMNSLCYLFSYQLSYLLQLGVPEWIATTTYYIGSIASDGAGNLYSSLTNANLNNALSDATNWKKITGVNTVQTKSADYQILAGDSLVRVSGTHTTTLPDATLVSGNKYTIKKIDSGTTSTIAFLSAQTADGQSTLTLTEQYGFYQFQSNGTNYDIIAWG